MAPPKPTPTELLLSFMVLSIIILPIARHPSATMVKGFDVSIIIDC